MKTKKRIKKIIGITAAIALMALSLTGCTSGTAKAGDSGVNLNNNEEKNNSKELRTIRVAFMTGTVDHYASIIGQEEGIYEKHGIKIEATEYPYGINTIDAIANGTADVGLCADFAGVNRIGNTLDYNQLVFYAELSSSKATTGGVYVAPEYADDLSKLENSPGWITSIGTRSEYDNWYVQTALGLDPDKQKSVNVDSTQTALAASVNGEASAVLSTGSQSKKTEEIGWKLVATSEEVSAVVGTYLVTSKSYIGNNTDILADYLAALDESIKYINEHLDNVGERLSAKLGVIPENFILDWKTPKLIIGFSEEGAENLDKIEKWAVSHGKFEKDYNVRDYIITSAVEKAFPDRVTLKK